MQQNHAGRFRMGKPPVLCPASCRPPDWIMAYAGLIGRAAGLTAKAIRTRRYELCQMSLLVWRM